KPSAARLSIARWSLRGACRHSRRNRLLASSVSSATPPRRRWLRDWRSNACVPMKRSTSPRHRALSWSMQGARNMSKAQSPPPVRVIEETSAYWRVVFDYPPFNVLDATIFEGLQNLLARMDASPSLRVVVFESANSDFYLAHFDLTGKTG